MEAVQRMRQKAQQFGYLRSGPQVTVSQGPDVEILPVDPNFIVVPYYDPYLVFAPPAPGFAIRGSIRFGFGVRIGSWFDPWGWGATRIIWGSRTLFLNNAPWGREWGNRALYVHPYPHLVRHAAPHLPDRHALVPRAQGERAAPRAGRLPTESHRR